MKVWLQHIGGALAILELRGRPQIQTELGYRLFSQLRTYIVRNLSFLPKVDAAANLSLVFILPTDSKASARSRAPTARSLSSF